MKIAIDGPAGAGKSVISKRIASDLKIVYVDTGALYRAVALYFIENSLDMENDVRSALQSVDLELKYIDGEQRVFLCGEDVSGKIRTPEVSMQASKVSAIPEVREFLLQLQKDIAGSTDCIMDGRDIGTVIMPDADVKIYLTASPEVRAERRLQELLKNGVEANFEGILNDIKKRDKSDMERKISPLRKADDAVEFDSSNYTIEEVVQNLEKIIGEKAGHGRYERN